MKLKSLFAIALAGMMMGACQSQDGKNGATPSDTAKADSLIYYFGQMRGVEYTREAENDSTLATPQARQDYLNGVRAGLNSVKADKDAYNRGVFLGMQMAMNMAQFEKDYGIRLSSKVFLESLSEAVNSDSTANTQELQKEFYRLISEFNKQKEEREQQNAVAALKEEAAKQKMAMITENLYGNVGKTDGEKIKDGDKVNLTILIKNAAGKEIKAPLPKTLVVGERMKESPLNDALLSLCPGQQGTFLTSAFALFGARCTQLDLDPSDVLTIEVTPILEEPAKEAAE